MQRYQIYLEKDAVHTLDQAAELLRVSRSRIIQDVVAKTAREFQKILHAQTIKTIQDHPLTSLAGIGKSPTGTLSRTVDTIYQKE